MDDVTVGCFWGEFESIACAWNGCGRRATCVRDDLPLCDRHDLLADRLQALETGFLVGLGLGFIHGLMDSD